MKQSTVKLKTKKYESEGNLAWQYNPLHNVVVAGGCTQALSDFDVSTDDLKFDMQHPVEIEVQPSYDGSVNLIMNDDHDVPRIVNSAFTVKEGWTYERILRNQQKQTNYYSSHQIDSETRLFRTTNTFLHVDLLDVESGGTLKGGNYTIFFKYSDDDGNETDWIGESGIISVFSGYPSHIDSIRGTLANEATDKLINLELSNIDVSFSNLCIYIQRNASDLTGVKSTEVYKINDSIPITGREMVITISGNEQTSPISTDNLNIEHNVFDFVATSTQVQNRLFFGNVGMIYEKQAELAQCALNIEMCVAHGSNSIGYVDCNYVPTSVEASEYYNPKNIYYSLGYWPNELYRLGVVFIYNNDTLSQAYNLKGCCFSNINDTNMLDGEFREYNLRETYIDGSSRYNTKGVFQMPDIKILGNGSISPMWLRAKVSEEVLHRLRKLNVKGLIFVRQPRIPIALAQGISVGISSRAHVPMLSKKDGDNTAYIAETVLSKDKTLRRNVLKSIDATGKELWESKCSALLCQDVNLNPNLQSMFYGNNFVVKPYAQYNLNTTDSYSRYYTADIFPYDTSDDDDWESVNLAYINPDVGSRIINKNIFSTKSGSESEVRTLRNLRWDSEYTVNDKRPVDEYTVRGKYSGYIGVLDKELIPNTLYTIYTDSYIGNNDTKRKNQIEIRANDQTPFHKTSQRLGLPSSGELNIDIYGGDCFTCTSSIKMCYNFLDYNTPLNDKIVSTEIKGNSSMDYNSWEVKELNLSDWNNVPIGHYVTYKSMSNYNLGIRCVDDQRIDERSLFGDARAFYPFAKSTLGVSFKIPESTLLNGGLSSVLSNKYYFTSELAPYIKKLFDTRICFSNMQHVDSFQNNYRVFSKLAYTDVERQYGAIIKLVPLGNNLFCVFEHGCGIVPINEKALMSTTTGQSIHLYGSDVVQSQVTVISPDYGSTWEESIIVTPNGIYGVDTFAKKIWRYSANGFSIISDMMIQRFLNDNINVTEYDNDPVVTYKNVKSHFNNYKGDVMFTFYNGDKEWNLCYNERLQKWTTRYSWTPGYSANIYNSFISTDKRQSSYYAKLSELVNVKKGISTDSTLNYIFNQESKKCEANNLSLDVVGYDDSQNVSGVEISHKMSLVLKSISVSYKDDVDVVHSTMSPLKSYSDLRHREYNWDLTQLGVKKKGDVVHLSAPGYNIFGILKSDFNFGTWKTNYSIEDYPEENIGPIYLYNRLLEENIFSDIIKYPTNTSRGVFSLSLDQTKYGDIIPFKIEAEFEYSIYKMLEYENDDPVQILIKTGKLELPLIASQQGLTQEQKEQLEDDLAIKLYVHGKAGNYSEINYSDDDPANQITPTKWYGRQEPFEFEFVVNQNVGMQKIFDNVVIISNNAEPDSIECTIVGDSYDFNKTNIFGSKEFGSDEFSNTDVSQNFDILFALRATDNLLFRTNIKKDDTLNQYTLSSCSKLRDISNSKYGRRLGNMTYLEDKWVITVDPIYYKTRYKTDITSTIIDNNDHSLDSDGSEYPDYSETEVVTRQIVESPVYTARLRDKWMKIRIKYKGDKLAVISAIQSLFTISFA